MLTVAHFSRSVLGGGAMYPGGFGSDDGRIISGISYLT